MANRFIDAQRIIRIFGEKYEILIPDDPGYYEKLFTRRAFLLFRQEEYEEALEAYSMAIVYASDVKYLAQMLTSRSYTYLKLGDAGPYFVNIDRFFAAYIDASEALKLDPNSFRALFFKGKALAALGFYSKARDCYKDLLKLIQKEDKSVNEAIAAIDGKVSF
uniref:Tetratricopeptide repeat protein n=1 Tax=Acrobeloides nanus TaxID=290746 RepID=A0A914CHF0_9BILA